MSMDPDERRRIYEEEKARMQEPRKSGFNWWAFIFGPFWYFYKGLWGKGLLLLLAAVVASGITLMIFGIGGWLVWIWAAAKANEDYYIDWRRRQQALGNAPTPGSGAPGS